MFSVGESRTDGPLNILNMLNKVGGLSQINEEHHIVDTLTYSAALVVRSISFPRQKKGTEKQYHSCILGS
jgi:hypothetical protein